jgi:hypothetical protein
MLVPHKREWGRPGYVLGWVCLPGVIFDGSGRSIASHVSSTVFASCSETAVQLANPLQSCSCFVLIGIRSRRGAASLLTFVYSISRSGHPYGRSASPPQEGGGRRGSVCRVQKVYLAKTGALGTVVLSPRRPGRMSGGLRHSARCRQSCAADHSGRQSLSSPGGSQR